MTALQAASCPETTTVPAAAGAMALPMQPGVCLATQQVPKPALATWCVMPAPRYASAGLAVTAAAGMTTARGQPSVSCLVRPVAAEADVCWM